MCPALAPKETEIERLRSLTRAACADINDMLTIIVNETDQDEVAVQVGAIAECVRMLASLA